MFKEGGVYRISLGIESASPRIMKLISKKHDLKKLDEAIQLFDKYRILAHGFLITGFPTETESDLDETIRFVLNSRLHTFRYSHYVPFRGTPLYNEYQHLFEKQGLADTINARYSFGQVYSEIPEDLTNDKIRLLSLKFYLNPQRVYRIAVAMNKKVMMRFIIRKSRQYLSRALGKIQIINNIKAHNTQH
jgi:radical SAM superfamily enzyme YgiQ (UPF0313 family)